MRKFLASLVVAGAAVFAIDAQEKKAADEKKPVEAKKAEEKPAEKAQPKKKAGSLKVGDAPPEFTADKWLQGKEVKSFEKGKVYIVEFWATWCGPCIVMMPHMGEMQAEYRDKGVTFIGYTKKDPNNSEEKVVEFVKKRGPKLGYTFAYSDEPDVYDAWMRAAGQNGIPCCFVVDQETKIAYIGHPMYLDVVLPKVAAGKWTAEDTATIADVEKEVNAVFGAIRDPKPETGLKVLADFEAKYPGLSKIPYFVGPKLSLLLKAKKYDDLKVVAKNLISRGTKSGDDSLLGQVANALRGPEAKGQQALLELSVKSAEEALKLAGEKDVRAMLGVAQSYYAAGDKTKGKEYSNKVLEAAEAPAKMQVGMMLSGSAIGAGDKATGVELAEQAMKAMPAMKSSITAQLAGSFLTAGDKASGEEYAKKALEAASDAQKPGVQSALARAYLTAGDKKVAADYAKQAVEGASEAAKPNIQFGLAQAYYLAGEKVTARGYAEKAIENSTGALQTNLRRALKQILDDPDGKLSDN